MRAPGMLGADINRLADRIVEALRGQRPIDLDVAFVNPLTRDTAKDARTAAEYIAAALRGAEV